MSGMKKTRPEAPNVACLRPDVCQDLTSACARSACQVERNATTVGLPQPAQHRKCVSLCSCAVCLCALAACVQLLSMSEYQNKLHVACSQIIPETHFHCSLKAAVLCPHGGELCVSVFQLSFPDVCVEFKSTATLGHLLFCPVPAEQCITCASCKHSQKFSFK